MREGKRCEGGSATVDEGVSGLFVETVRACCSRWVTAGSSFQNAFARLPRVYVQGVFGKGTHSLFIREASLAHGVVDSGSSLLSPLTHHANGLIPSHPPISR